MKRFTFGSLIPNSQVQATIRAGKPIPKTVVVADEYRIENQFVTFYREGAAFLSVPFARAEIVAELTEDNDLPFKGVDYNE